MSNRTIGGGHVTAAEVIKLAADAAFRAVVVDRGGGAVLSYGRKRRLASPAQRAAVNIETNGVCAHPLCSNPVNTVHHIEGWKHGGPTDLTNLLGLCWAHHDDLQAHGWSVTKHPDGTLTWCRPDGTELDPTPGWSAPREKAGGRDRSPEKPPGRAGAA